MDNVIEQATVVFRKVFDNDELELARSLTASEVDGWDSLSHVHLIIALEKTFKIKFKSSEVIAFKNVGELLDLVQAKVKLNPI